MTTDTRLARFLGVLDTVASGIVRFPAQEQAHAPTLGEVAAVVGPADLTHLIIAPGTGEVLATGRFLKAAVAVVKSAAASGDDGWRPLYKFVLLATREVIESHVTRTGRGASFECTVDVLSRQLAVIADVSDEDAVRGRPLVRKAALESEGLVPRHHL